MGALCWVASKERPEPAKTSNEVGTTPTQRAPANVVTTGCQSDQSSPRWRVRQTTKQERSPAPDFLDAGAGDHCWLRAATLTQPYLEGLARSAVRLAENSETDRHG